MLRRRLRKTGVWNLRVGRVKKPGAGKKNVLSGELNWIDLKMTG